MNLEQAFYQIAATFRMRPVTTTKVFLHVIFYSSLLLVSNIDLTGKKILLCCNLRKFKDTISQSVNTRIRLILWDTIQGHDYENPRTQNPRFTIIISA